MLLIFLAKAGKYVSFHHEISTTQILSQMIAPSELYHFSVFLHFTCGHFMRFFLALLPCLPAQLDSVGIRSSAHSRRPHFRLPTPDLPCCCFPSGLTGIPLQSI